MSWVEKLGRTGSCKFPTEEIAGGLNFNFAPQLPQIWGFRFSPNVAFLDENFPTRRDFFNNFEATQNLGGGGNCLPCYDASALQLNPILQNYSV